MNRSLRAVDDAPEPQRDSPPSPAGRNGNGNGGVTKYRLDEIERRLESVEQDVKTLTRLCVTIQSRIETLMWVLGVTVAVASILIHLIIRTE